MKTRFVVVFSILTTLLLLGSSQTFSQNSSTNNRLKQVETNLATSSANQKLSNFNTTFTEGQVIGISNGILTLATKQGTKIIYLVDSTKILNFDTGGKTIIGVTDLKANDQVLILGLPELANSGTAKIIVRDTNKPVSNFSLIGKVSSSTDTTLSIENFSRADLPTINLSLAQNLVITTLSSTIKPSQMKPKDKIVLAGTIDDKGNLNPDKILDLSLQTNSISTTSAK